jgi:hypothetical protein
MKAWLSVLLFLVCLPALAQNATLLREDTLRDEPFSDAKPLAKIGGGVSVRILERKGNWVSVEARAGRGWIRALNLKGDGPAVRAEGVAALQTGREAKGGLAVPLAVRAIRVPGPAKRLLDELLGKRDATRVVTLSAQRGSEGELQLELASDRAGYAYVFLADSAAQGVQCVFPNAVQPDNEIVAMKTLALPGKGWRVDADERRGELALLVLIADTPLDLLTLDKQPEGPLFNVPVNADNQERVAAVLSGGCTARACNTYAAASAVVEASR